MWAYALGVAVSLQFMKFMIYSIVRGRPNLRALLSSNGLPSLHAVLVTCLATMIWSVRGGEDAAYNAVLIYGAIILHDTMKVKVRVEQGRETAHLVAERLQRRLAHPFRWRELLLPVSARRSHRPGHVIIGAFLGILLGLQWQGSP